MSSFQYKAMDARGKVSMGTMEAVNMSDLELRLSRMGLDLIQLKEVRARGPNISARHIQRRDLIDFCFNMEQLTSSGVPLIDALGDLRDSIENPRFKEVLASMVDNIEGGESLSDALGHFPKIFDTVFVSLVRAGEQSGRIGDVLKHITDSLKWEDEQAAQTKKLLMYPIFVGSVVVIVVLFLMVYLVPELISFISGMGGELPGHTKALIATSDFMVDFWYILVSLPVVLFVAIKYLASVSPSARMTLDRFKLRLPVIGPILEKITLARFSNLFAMMYASGITVLECIEISQRVVDNVAISEAMAEAGRSIAEGGSISASFEQVKIFPPLVLRMLRVGESTGALDKAMMNVGYFYNRDVSESIQRLQAMIGPAMTVVLGGILMWVMVSVLGPIYDLITNLKV